jgi:hypothetical protein
MVEVGTTVVGMALRRTASTTRTIRKTIRMVVTLRRMASKGMETGKSLSFSEYTMPFSESWSSSSSTKGSVKKKALYNSNL